MAIALLLGVCATTWSAERGPAVTFERDIQPLLTRYGCNSGPCHGKSRGQNGFALSLLGFDGDFDYAALVHQGRGRRIAGGATEQSLLVRKALGQVPHGGGQRFAPGSEPDRLLQAWIGAGVPRTPEDAPELTHVEVSPPQQSLQFGEETPLQVRAHYADGTSRVVTKASAFQSNDSAIAAVDEWGTVKAGPVPGETAVMARYMNHIAVARVTIPLPDPVSAETYDRLPRQHPVDRLVWDKLKLLGMLPSELADDATFHRRAFLRIIGRLPRPEETRSFLADGSAEKRAELVDHLLQQPEYADFWANKWADLLRPNPYRVGIKAVWSLDAWLRHAFRENMPYDEFVRQLVTAKGSTWRNGATVIFRDRPSTVEIGSSVSQLFLGVRLECAKCHHHPFEVWSQDDFYGFAAFFARVGHHGGLSPPISGGEELIYTKSSGSLAHGRTGDPVTPKTLTGDECTAEPDVDPRESLAAWMLDAENPFFAQVIANRVWADLMGKGIVEPIDDMRATNPASNAALLEFLATELRRQQFDLKKLIRTIATSQVFQLSAEPSARNVTDTNHFSRYYRQRLRAEVLLDGINDILNSQESFAAMPQGSRATQLWTHRSASVFLDTFGRPDPNQDPPCERTTDSTTPQVLHLMNSPELNAKLARDGARPHELAEGELGVEALAEEIYLYVVCRPPTSEELAKATAHLESSESRRQAIEDLFWALMNTPEFLFLQ